MVLLTHSYQTFCHLVISHLCKNIDFWYQITKSSLGHFCVFLWCEQFVFRKMQGTGRAHGETGEDDSICLSLEHCSQSIWRSVIKTCIPFLNTLFYSTTHFNDFPPWLREIYRENFLPGVISKLCRAKCHSGVFLYLSHCLSNIIYLTIIIIARRNELIFVAIWLYPSEQNHMPLK